MHLKVTQKQEGKATGSSMGAVCSNTLLITKKVYRLLLLVMKKLFPAFYVQREKNLVSRKQRSFQLFPPYQLYSIISATADPSVVNAPCQLLGLESV